MSQNRKPIPKPIALRYAMNATNGSFVHFSSNRNEREAENEIHGSQRHGIDVNWEIGSRYDCCVAGTHQGQTHVAEAFL